MKKTSVKKIAVSAILIALGAVLSLIKPLPPMPLGGSVTLFSMVPITLIAVMFGTRWGLFSAFVYSLVQIGLDVAGMMSWGMDARMWVGAIVFDYLVAYTVIGFSGLFRKKGFIGICFGICLALSLRFISHFVSGCIFFAIWSPWDNPYIYSVCYNGAYMLPELIFTVIAVAILYKTDAIKRLLNEAQ
ncbi:MAG: energy-coupled thiamine transporter ThiT [Clostridia bacterium]|nr:energy-coupled thiamine transporter ThiT [Clostridia bacterium]